MPVRLTAGFNPRPRLVFLHALAVGIESVCEEVEIEFVRKVDLADLQRRLADGLRPVLEVAGCARLPPTRRGRRVRSCTYRVRGCPDAGVAERARRRLVEAEALPVRVQRKGEAQTVDLGKWLVDVRSEPNGLTVTLGHSEQGAGRIDTVLTWLGEAFPEWVRREAVKVEMDMA